MYLQRILSNIFVYVDYHFSKFLQFIQHVYHTCAHSQFLHSITLTGLWIPHLPNIVFEDCIYPFLGYLLVQFGLSAVSQSFQDEIIGCSPRWSSPHQVYGVYRVIGWVWPWDSRNRIIWFVVLFLYIGIFTSFSMVMMLSLCLSGISGTISGNKAWTVFLWAVLY